jgi:hypothetical protein
MTTFVPGTNGDLPTECNTVEKAAAWVYTRAKYLQPTMTYTPIAGGREERVISTAIKSVPDETERFVGAAFVPMVSNADWATGRLWEKVTPGKLIGTNSPLNDTDEFIPGTNGTIFSTVNTIQRAIVYLTMVLVQTCGYKASVEQSYNPLDGSGGVLLPFASVQPIQSDNHGLLYYFRISLPINANHHWMPGSTWEKMLEATHTEIADDNKAN